MLEWILRIIAVCGWVVLVLLTLFVGSFFIMYWLAWLFYKLVEWIGVWW